MTTPPDVRYPFEFLVLASDDEDRQRIAARVFAEFAALDLYEMGDPSTFIPVHLHVHQHDRAVFDQTGDLVPLLHRLTDWAYGEDAHLTPAGTDRHG